MSSRAGSEDRAESVSAAEALATLAERYARPSRWAPVPEALDRAIAADAALAEAARRCRQTLPDRVTQRLSPFLAPASFRPYLEVLREVPRERFVLPEDLALSAVDTPLPLDREGLATISAPHAYLLTYALLDLREGDQLLELGTGTGYGAALALAFLGPRGRVTSIEIDPLLAARARLLLTLLPSDPPGRLTLIEGDACLLAERLIPAFPDAGPPLKIAFTFGLLAPPERLVGLLPERAVLVAPVRTPASIGGDDQELLRWERRGGELLLTAHGPVRYVTERHER